ncbi:amino acid permease [Niveomyces insectorum RCEF 264]|uniref:Amino acid permease n=1 Tax=Niveomyces insectorum RCEF 264 TaxID=1081102 RepID=A0A162MUD9_9HYPO|nr:amino acid permease [Niveomyces insectorum RCEF 264]
MSDTDSGKNYMVEISSEAHVFETGKLSARGGTEADERDMEMLGRKQVLNRNFRFLSTLGFACTLMSTWEIVLMTSSFGLVNGGLAGLVWGYLIVWMGYMLVFASIAEMASMAPTSGGQYHWISEFAPPRAQKFFSYTIGWIAVLGWQTGITSLAFLAGTMIQGLLVLCQPTYVFANWHGTLLVIAITAFCILFNTVLAGRLPVVEGTVLVVHIVGFFAVLLPLWVLAPRTSPADVFGAFTNLGGWSSTGLAVMVGLLSPVYTLIGADSTVHMAEEVRDASRVLPRAILTAATLNGAMGWIMLITFCFTLGDVAAIVDSPTGYPFIAAFYNATNSFAGTAVMTSILIVNVTSACISTVATVSRQTWSFARDGGLPGSAFIAHVKPGWNIPLNAVLLTFTITALLSLINIGSSVAFNAIGSLAVSALLGTYLISFSFLILRRLRGPALPASRWSLGRWGLAVNVGAVAFLAVVWVFVFFPQTATVTPETMNWNVVMFCGTMIFAVVYYFAWGHKCYRPPVSLVKRDLD